MNGALYVGKQMKVENQTGQNFLCTPKRLLEIVRHARSQSSVRITTFIVALLALAVPVALVAQATDRAANVNPLIGTDFGPGGGNNLFPGATTPFGMVQLSPDTEDRGFGYHYNQSDIHGFSMTHMSGVGCDNAGDVFFTATTGPIHTQVLDYKSPYSHTLEFASPGYYQVRLLAWDINAQLSATDRTGIVQFTFPSGKPANILVPISHTLANATAAQIRIIGDRQIEGFVENHIFCHSSQTYKVYFVMTFSQPFSSFGTWSNPKDKNAENITAENRSAEQSTYDTSTGAHVTWVPQDHTQTITAKIAISYVDSDGAANNLKVEAANKDFAQIRADAHAAWNRNLSVIDVSGGSAIQKTVFYTALYHSLLMPSIISDADGRYLGFDDVIHRTPSGHPVYANYSGWDIYRSEIPLLAMIAPQRMQDMAQSIVLMYKQGGWIDRWPQINRYTNVMGGSPLSIILATAWLDGLHGFDMAAAWPGMLKDATEAPPPGHPYQGETGIEWINQLHYEPNEISKESVSDFQEDTIAYASLYRLAVSLGKTGEAETLYNRALYYRNVFDPNTRFFRPRNANGQWTPNFDPSSRLRGFDEGTAWQYLWLVPHDLAWVINAVGRDLFNQRLEYAFSYRVPAWYGHYFNPYNENDLEVPYEFNFSGKPWESQRVVRRILKENYTTAPNGIPGNDDGGAMCSWAVLSMIGIYSVDPASLAYELVSPSFSRVIIHLQAPYSGKTFTIETQGSPANNPYIQNVRLNGHTRSKNWIEFHSIADGGNLHFTLGPNPNKAWGVAPTDAPPSLSSQQPNNKVGR
jgi:predicted alpha-1,2-mannosidase